MSFISNKAARFIFVSLCIFILYLIPQVLKMREVKIEDTEQSKAQEYVFLARDAFFRIPVKEGADMIEFSSRLYKMNKDSLVKFEDNYLKTQKIKNLNFEGPVEIFFYNKETSHFESPGHVILRNKENQDYFIETNKSKGIFDKGVFETEQKFQFNHQDFFASGDNLYVSNDFNDILITRNSKVISKKENPADNTIITSEFLNYFKLLGYAIFKKKVHLIQKETTTDSEFLKAFIGQDGKGSDQIESAIFKTNVVFTRKASSQIRSNIAYYFQKENVFIFCDNVEIESQKGFSRADFYVYYNETKQLVNLQENNRFFLEKIKKLDKQAPDSCTKFEEKLSKFLIKKDK